MTSKSLTSQIMFYGSFNKQIQVPGTGVCGSTKQNTKKNRACFNHVEYHIIRAAGAQVEGVCPVTGGLLVRSSALTISVVVSLGKTLYPTCLLMVRGLGGACVWRPHFCQCACLWLHRSSCV
ncbi:hypothetical protein GOODEAATRI_028452 [Goodea atripinnis]|uniref:Uncharacterized protein n=1 Tax=Goodea atripinnis TaxID=208336 RepID=A0ABV0Q1U5_9TELE